MGIIEHYPLPSLKANLIFSDFIRIRPEIKLSINLDSTILV
jgi:hypothetical protein